MLASSLYLSTAVTAGTVDYLDMTLEQLLKVPVYSVDRSENDSFSSPAAITVITRAEIERSAALTLTDLLAHVPGLYVRELNRDRVASSSRNDTQMYLSNLLLLVDGQTLSPPTTNTANWPMFELPLALIERVEIIRGSGTPLWGSNAAGGVINVITRAARSTDASHTEFAIGNDGMRRLYGEISGGSETQHWRVQGQRAQDDGYNAHYPLQAERDVGTVYYDGTSERWRWQAQWRGTRLYSEELSALSGQQQQARTYSNNFLLQTRYQIDAQQTLKMLATNSHSYNAIGTLELVSRDRAQEYDVTYHYDEAQWAALLGANRREHELEIDGTPMLDYRDLPITVRYESLYFTGRWAPSASWRADMSLRDEYYSLSDDRELAYGARLAWQPDQQHALWLSLNRGFQQPNITQTKLINLVGTLAQPPALIYVQGRDDLHAETVNDVQLGWRWRLHHDHQIELSLFRDRALDQIYIDTAHPQFVPGTPNRLLIYYRNQIDSTSKGGELVWRAQWQQSCHSDFSYSYFAEAASSQTGAIVTAPSYAPRDKYDLYSECHYAEQAFSMRLLRESAYANEGAGGLFQSPDRYIHIAPHWRLDLAWQYALGKNMTLQLAALNLGNEQINWNYPLGYAPATRVHPRYWLGLQARW